MARQSNVRRRTRVVRDDPTTRHLDAAICGFGLRELGHTADVGHLIGTNVNDALIGLERDES